MGKLILNGIEYAGGGGSGGGASSKTPYLKSSGTQYIDTGIKSKGTISISCEFFLDIDQYDKTADWVTVFAGADANTVNSILFAYKQSSNTITFQYGSSFGDQSRAMTPCIKHTAAIIKGITYMDGTPYADWGSKTYTTSKNIYVFTGNVGSDEPAYSKICLTACKIWDGNTLVRDFVPTMNNNVACLYDKVSETYFTNQGTGNFIYGELD